MNDDVSECFNWTFLPQLTTRTSQDTRLNKTFTDWISSHALRPEPTSIESQDTIPIHKKYGNAIIGYWLILVFLINKTPADKPYSTIPS